VRLGARDWGLARGFVRRGAPYALTDKQIRYLLNLGAKPKTLEDITKPQASAMITRLTELERVLRPQNMAQRTLEA
jgi:hypothetical protein